MKGHFSILLMMIMAMLLMACGSVTSQQTATTSGGNSVGADPAVLGAKKKAQKVDYGRILFVGDSRTVDMFSADEWEFRNLQRDGVTVYCRHACDFSFLVEAVDEYGVDNFDTLVSWMGCNDKGDFSNYGPYYDQLIAQGKKVVVCTVGPTQDEYLNEGNGDNINYVDANQVKYNDALKTWAKGQGVKVIDLYTFISKSKTITISTEDGIHYFPQPTTELWSYVLSSLK